MSVHKLAKQCEVQDVVVMGAGLCGVGAACRYRTEFQDFDEFQRMKNLTAPKCGPGGHPFV